MYGTCKLAADLDIDFMLERRAGQTPEIWNENAQNAAMPMRNGRQVAAELAGRKLTRLTMDQFESTRQGMETWLTISPPCPKCAGKGLHLPKELTERNWAVVIDPAQIDEIQGPRRIVLGDGVEYYLPKGYGKNAILNYFGTYIGEVKNPSPETPESVGSAAIRVLTALFRTILANFTPTFLYEATDRHGLLEWAAQVDLGVVSDTYVSLGIWELEPHTERFGMQGSVAQIHNQGKWVRDFNQSVSIKEEHKKDYGILEAVARDVLTPAINAGQGDLREDPESTHLRRFDGTRP
jgi:hypothetical protein